MDPADFIQDLRFDTTCFIVAFTLAFVVMFTGSAILALRNHLSERSTH